ncbi:MAG TPA: hypothetical protein VMX35_05480 [Acidobacteriota bacterium]|nr:hypothetical protein [Acidobacteriota bacterium]
MSILRSTVLCVFLLYPLGGLLCAQEESQSAEEILLWFPMGHYSYILHEDRAGLMGREAYGLYKKYIEESRPSTFPGYLPPLLQDGFNSATGAKLRKLKFYKADAPKELEIEGKIEAISDVGGSLWVFRFDELDSLVTRASDLGQIDPLGVLIDGRQVYKYRSQDSGQELFGFATPTQEFLVADELRLVKAMISAGTFQGPNILDGENYVDITDFFADLGDTWFINFHMTTNRIRLERLRNQGGSEATLSWLESKLEHGLDFTISTYLVDDAITWRQYLVYTDEEYAAENHKDPFREVRFIGNPPYIKPFHDLINKYRSEDVRDGNVVVITVVYNDELLEGARQYRMEAVKYHQEVDKQREKEGNEKH